MMFLVSVIVVMRIRCIFIRLSRNFQNRFQLGDWQHRKETCKQQEEHEEQTDCSDVNPDVNVRREVHAPSRRQIVSVQGCYNDYITLEPHTDVYNNRNDECEQ